MNRIANYYEVGIQDPETGETWMVRFYGAEDPKNVVRAMWGHFKRRHSNLQLGQLMAMLRAYQKARVKT